MLIPGVDCDSGGEADAEGGCGRRVERNWGSNQQRFGNLRRLLFFFGVPFESGALAVGDFISVISKGHFGD